MRCPKCKKTLGAGDDFCENCGSRVPEQKKSSELPLVLLFLILTMLLVAGVCVWILQDEYHEAGEHSSETVLQAEETQESAEEATEIPVVENETEEQALTAETESEQEQSETEEAAEETTGTELEMVETTAASTTEEKLAYFIENCTTQLFDAEYFAGFDAEQCRKARNGIYARSGRIFQDTALQAYYETFDWYVGSIAAADFSQSLLNSYQLTNLEVIVAVEAALGT